MENLIKILVEKFNMSEIAAKRNAKKLSKYDDISSEFLNTVNEGKYPEEGLKAGDYTALDIHNMTDVLSVVGVYNFMVTLRESPDKAKEIIESGFPVK